MAVFTQRIPRACLFTGYDRAVLRARKNKKPAFHGGMLICKCGAVWAIQDSRLNEVQYRKFIETGRCPACPEEV